MNKKNKKFNFKIGTIKCPKKISRPNLLLDINTKEDYLFINKIYNHFKKKNFHISIKDIINYHDQNNKNL